ncbi:arrestin domain-containing protein [Phlyctema vagabunda]|uniref:Arrestin domain-containing protein n=1 Tax=Phlyctema vagabunda TaxID=108571 RepID=A0ABR4PFE8_9HELO
MPSFGFGSFGGVTGRTSATLFEIRLDSDIIILRGGENEASSQLLKGAVVLCLPASLKCEDVHLRMTGQLKVGWNDQRLTPTGISNNRVDKTTEIFSHRWAPFVGGGGPGSSSRGTTLPAGNYEWPFELVIPGSMAESVEGLADSHIVYKLKATVARGKLAYDLHAWKPVRIVRTLDPSALELAHAMTVENVWPNKIEYQLVIPQKAIVFGTAIEIEMRFTSLLKGLRIGQIKCILLEQQEFTIPGASAHTERHWKHARDVETWVFELNEDEHYHDLLDENGQDGYTLKERMPLPKRLSKCIQDVDVSGIKIRHKVKFNIALHNPDGHVSELRATLPVTIFISPNMPLNADGCLVDQTPMSTESVDIKSHAPPLYGEHVLDQLYAGMDQSGLMTPAPQSGMNTPFYSQSRAGSSENLASLDSIANSNGAVPPAALTSRLQNLNSGSRNSSFLRRHPGGSGDVTPAYPQPSSENRQSGYFDSHSASHSTPLSRRTSEEEEHHHNGNISGVTSGRHSPEHDEFLDLAELSKVPSYTTAVRTPLKRGASYVDSSLPNYEAALSAPPSPTRGFSQPSTPGESSGHEATAHANSHAHAHVNSHANSHGHAHAHAHGGRRNHLAGFGFTPIHAPAQAHIGDEDERRRLHLLRNRERAQ